MRRYSAIITVLFIGLWAGLAIAQTDNTPSVPYVYRLKIDGCKFEPVARRQTGFRVQGLIGIVTALHGVADCQTVSAVADDGMVFTELAISAIDIDHDTALLTSPVLEELPTDGLVPSPLSNTEILTATLRIVGYPLGLDKQDVDTIESVRDIESLDQIIPDAEESTDFLKRKSPDIDIDVLNLQAQLLPGHSGAPVIDQADQIVAVGDGGLRGGAVGRSWAIPWQAVNLESVNLDEIREMLTELATKNITSLSFSSTYPGQLGDAAKLATYMVRVVDTNNTPIANAEVLLTHSAGYEIGMTDSKGFYTFQLPTNVSYIQSQVQVEAPGYPSYSRTLSNVLDKVGTEILRLTALRPTPSVSFCEFAFRILDEKSEQPIVKANLSVTLGSRLTTGKTDSNGFYESRLPCVDPLGATVKVRVVAEGYKQHSETVPLIGEVKEIMLALTVLPTPTPTSKDLVVAPVTTPTPTNTTVPTLELFYFTISITEIANNSTNEGYTLPPLGSTTLGGIPFNLPAGQNSVTTQAKALQNNPTEIRLTKLDIKSPRSVHLLITGGSTRLAFKNKKIGEIHLIFSDNQSQSIDLIPGVNLREWKNYGDHNVITTSASNVAQVWTTTLFLRK